LEQALGINELLGPQQLLNLRLPPADSGPEALPLPRCCGKPASLSVSSNETNAPMLGHKDILSPWSGLLFLFPDNELAITIFQGTQRLNGRRS
jgi:hypothetical protein